jgi:hypothetical protein
MSHRKTDLGIPCRSKSAKVVLVTTAVKRGVNLMKVCDQTGHKSLEMLRVYSRDAELFAGNAAAELL